MVADQNPISSDFVCLLPRNGFTDFDETSFLSFMHELESYKATRNLYTSFVEVET